MISKTISFTISIIFVSIFISVFLLLVSSNALGATCTKPVIECVEPGGTKYFEGHPVTLDCWRKKVTYECKADSDNNCQNLKNQGCSPGSATCKTVWGGVCAAHDITFDCPINKCEHRDMACSNSKAFCASGNCMSQERVEDKDMNKSLAALSAAAEAVNYLDTSKPQELKIFGGKARECSKNIASSITKDCCGISGSGFLEGKILKCEDDELEIARAKEVGRAVELGEYCHNKVLGICTSYHKTYCLFQSKLARIIQVGARSQLGVPFGGPQSANCRALTQKEFQRVDFSKIDFSEFYKDIEEKAKQKSPESIVGKAKQASEEYKKRADQFKGNVEKIRDKMQSKMRGAQTNTEKVTEVSILKREVENKKGW